MPARVQLEGRRFGRLTVVAFAEMGTHSRSKWLCLCDCGKQTVTWAYRLHNGRVRSCGCLHREMVAAQFRTHGATYTRSSWCSMIRRVKEPWHPGYENYGGRGIKVCERWLSFENFLADMGHRPRGFTLDRVDPNGNYEPSNCRWATRSQQQRNRRRNRKETLNGETRLLIEWAELFHVPPNCVQKRINRGWPIEKALTQPSQRNRE